MPCIAVGQSTGKIYATGSKADCIRTLQEKYPTFTHRKGSSIDFTKPAAAILPETIIIVRKGMKS